jgi:hypothetical protein
LRGFSKRQDDTPLMITLLPADRITGILPPSIVVQNIGRGDWSLRGNCNT